MAASFVAYIDESGDEGFLFEKGSSEWFVLSAVITRKSVDLETVKLVDRVRERLNKRDKEPLHFRYLKHEHRLPFVTEIANARLRAISILIHKPSIREQANFKERFRLYFYASRYLFERISWCCRDHRSEDDEGDGSAEIIFSNRGGMSYAELRNYIDVLKTQIHVTVDWSVVKSDQIMAYPHEKRMGLQIADAIASSFYYSVQPSRHGFTEDRYVRILKPIVYHFDKSCRNYGVKFWPGEAETLITNASEYESLRAIYP